MVKVERPIEWRTHSALAIRINDVVLTPQAWTLTVRWPNGGLVWSRPVGVLVERAGERERIRIVDVTRVSQLLFLGLPLMFVSLQLALAFRQRRLRDE
ncbi:MAG: hypothetical protein M3220_10625 [Chloroflexota bacterium]|nr:hypothetical protein [Chloroflexota bacterium]